MPRRFGASHIVAGLLGASNNVAGHFGASHNVAGLFGANYLGKIIFVNNEFVLYLCSIYYLRTTPTPKIQNKQQKQWYELEKISIFFLVMSNSDYI